MRNYDKDNEVRQVICEAKTVVMVDMKKVNWETDK